MTENVSVSYSNIIQNQEKPYPFLLKKMTSPDRKSAFLTEEMLPSDRPSPFLENRADDSEKASSPLELPKTKENETEESEIKNTSLPKNDALIISELQRNPMSSTLTIRDIAEDFDIPYQKAMNIYKAVNGDSNGVAKEFYLPENATVSYLV